ncbi:hypothetical protein [Aliivibrio fischeri]|uniref:hypothetical protein n=1 Tax=Aliivibrio fischeri TaxID=668 RepID=UPI0012DA6036|nr:hypothetical protein [Aliivibrio fischeri]MUJ23889.1 hypothetical protein [Aliivibrio fischeri]
MAIPWLIGAAVVGLVGSAIKSSIEEDEAKERQERWEREERSRLHQEEQERIDNARKDEALRVQRQIEKEKKALIHQESMRLMEKYEISDLSSTEFKSYISNIIVNGVSDSTSEIEKILSSSKKMIEVKEEESQLEKQLKELKEIQRYLESI